MKNLEALSCTGLEARALARQRQYCNTSLFTKPGTF